MPAGENMACNPWIRRPRIASTDRVDQPEAFRLEAALHDRAQCAEIGKPDMLQHAYGDENIALAGDGPVVVLDEGDPIRKAPLFRPFPCIGDLFARIV